MRSMLPLNRSTRCGAGLHRDSIAPQPCHRRCRVAQTTRAHQQAEAQTGQHAYETVASCGRRGVASLLAAALVLTSAPTVYAQDAGTAQRAVTEYIELDGQGKFGKGGSPSKALDDFRARYRIRRGADGRVQLRSSKGEWFQVRLDMEVPGSMLLRDSKGNIFAIQTEAIQQIDLSDDLVVLMMFTDGEWEKQMSAVEFADEGGTKQLQMEEKEFREVIGLLKEVQDLEGEEATAGSLPR